MSISTEAVIVVGYTYDQIERSLKDGAEEFIEDETLSFSSLIMMHLGKIVFSE